MDDDNQAPESARRREVSAATLTARAARQLVAPVHQQMAMFQASTIKLETMAQRLKASGRQDAGLTEATQALLSSVQSQAQRLEKLVAEAPERVREHGRIADTRQVLQALETRLSATLADLGGTPGKR